MKTPRGASESSTTSDNTTEFIDIVKKYDVVYNTHNPDYKNVEVKMKVWSQIAEEIGLSVGRCLYASLCACLYVCMSKLFVKVFT